jgi:4-amino-4-deoxy-L-arabinose transferase-like glycosyltransferase
MEIPLALSAEHQRRSLPYWILAGITASAASVRFFHLVRESIWFDEGISIWLAQMNLKSMWAVVSTNEANMAFYYLLLHGWLALGESEFTVRSLSAAIAVLTIPALFFLARSLFNTRVALISSALLAANTFHIKYSREARAYALVVLLVTLSSSFFVRAIQRQTRIDWVCYVLTATLASYSHFFAWLVVGSQWLSLLALPRREVPWRRFAVSAAAIALFSAPLVAAIRSDNNDHLSWIPRADFSKLYELFVEFAGLSKKGLPIFAVVCLVAAFFVMRDRRKVPSPYERWHIVLLLVWLFMPVLVTFGLSQWRPIFVDRFLIVCLPAFLVLFAAALSRIPSRTAVALLLSVILGSEARAIAMYEEKLTKQDWRGASEYILSQDKPTDGFLFYVPWGEIGFDYYSRLARHAWEAHALVHGAADPSGKRDTPGATLPLNLHQQFPRVWLVRALLYSSQLEQDGQTLKRNLEGQYRQVEERSFRGVEVTLYSSEEADKTALKGVGTTQNKAEKDSLIAGK